MADENAREAVSPDTRLIEAFHLMWGAYPGPASLIHKSRIIIAVNKAGLEAGRKPGMICVRIGSPFIHRGCLADRTLNEGEPFYKESRTKEGVKRIYWLPLSGYPDYYIHFTAPPVQTAAPKNKGPRIKRA